MSLYKVVGEINRQSCYLARSRYPWMQVMPNQWSTLVKRLEDYTPATLRRVVQWKKPKVGGYSYNTDEVAKGNLGPNSYAFCIRDHNGNFM